MWVDTPAKMPTEQRRRSRFPTKREGPVRGRRRHAVVVEALVPPDAARVATVYTNAPKWRREARPSHLCALLRSQGHPQPKPTTQQCTQTLQNGAEGAISTELCTLLCRHPGGEARVARAVTQPPTRTYEASAYGWLLSVSDRKPALSSRSGPHHLHRRNRPLSLRP